MADLISRKAAMDVFMGKPPDFYHTSYIVGEINCLPSVEAVPVVHGRWIDECCSECGQYVYQGDSRNYCPNCGAKIDGWVDAMPAADAAAVVRCAECRYCYDAGQDPLVPYDGEDVWHCEMWDREVSAYQVDPYRFFCAKGERRKTT